MGPTTDPFLMRTLLAGRRHAGWQKPSASTRSAPSLGLALKFFLSAFEYAWAPFYFQTMKEKDAQRTFATITTYGLAVLVLLSAGLSAVARDLVRLMTSPGVSTTAGRRDPVDHASPSTLQGSTC